MNSTITTAGGTAVFEPLEQEYNTYLERRIQSRLSMSLAEFTHAYREGRLDETDTAVSELIALLGIRDNGH